MRRLRRRSMRRPGRSAGLPWRAMRAFRDGVARAPLPRSQAKAWCWTVGRFIGWPRSRGRRRRRHPGVEAGAESARKSSSSSVSSSQSRGAGSVMVSFPVGMRSAMVAAGGWVWFLGRWGAGGDESAAPAGPFALASESRTPSLPSWREEWARRADLGASSVGRRTECWFRPSTAHLCSTENCALGMGEAWLPVHAVGQANKDGAAHDARLGDEDAVEARSGSGRYEGGSCRGGLRSVAGRFITGLRPGSWKRDLAAGKTQQAKPRDVQGCVRKAPQGGGTDTRRSSCRSEFIRHRGSGGQCRR